MRYNLRRTPARLARLPKMEVSRTTDTTTGKTLVTTTVYDKVSKSWVKLETRTEPDGPIKQWTVDGQCICNGSIKNNQFTGRVRGLNKKGLRIYEGTYLNDVLHGLWSYYSEDQTTCVFCYYDQGLLQGDYQLFSRDIENKVYHYRGHYHQGKKQGVWLFTNSSGVVLQEEFYMDGELHTSTHQWNENRSVHYQWVYDHGHLTHFSSEIAYK
jgi:antitoxin component YwqK of YwqJK toxin-antitoxin module